MSGQLKHGGFDKDGYRQGGSVLPWLGGGESKSTQRERQAGIEEEIGFLPAIAVI